jgi:hypothetical protein
MIPLPWERVLWTGRSLRPGSRARYVLTDFRIASVLDASVSSEIPLDEIAEVERTESRLERMTGTSTVVVRSIRGATLVLRSITRGAAVAALVELLSGEPLSAAGIEAARSALEWHPQADATGRRETLMGAAAVAVAVLAMVIGLHGKTAPMAFASDDPLYPNGQKRPDADIVRFMENVVMPWAREAIGPLKGGADRISCDTCHGKDAAARGWRMPAVAALPQPDLREQGWELYGGALDAQMRNAIYGYLAESDKQSRATYMREVVMPGMADLLRRPAYDFTQPYEYNRSRRAFGCYHCHRIK